MTTRTIKLALVGTLLLALGAAQALAQGIPIIYCSEQAPATPGATAPTPQNRW